MPGLLWLEWERSVNGYTILKPAPDFFDAEEDREPDLRDFYLEPESDDTVIYRPFEENSALFMTFAEVSQTPEGVKDFADRFGLLLKRPKDEYEPEIPIAAWLKFIRRMQGATDMWARSREQGSVEHLIEVLSAQSMYQATMYLRPVNDPLRAALHLRPSTLYYGMWMQFAEAVANNAQLRQCARCRKWIAFGSGTGRRESSKFCSPACRRAAWKEAKESRK